MRLTVRFIALLSVVFAIAGLGAGAASAQAHSGKVGTQQKTAATVMDVRTKTIWVAVDYARLRSGPTTSKPNVVYKAMAGQGFMADCWTQENFHPTGGYVWYHGTPWGSGKFGYMRVDMFRADHWQGGSLNRC